MTPPARRRVPLGRTISALVALVVALLTVWIGWPLLLPTYLILTLLALQEYGKLLQLRGVAPRRRSLMLAAVLTLPAALPAGVLGMPAAPEGVSWRELLLALFALYLIALEVSRPSGHALQSVIFTLFGYLWIPWGFSYLITLRYLPDAELGLWTLALVMLAVVASDIGAYLVGTLFGRRTLAPAISPNKTLEGALGGIGLAAVTVGAMTLLLRARFDFGLGLVDALLLALLVASVAELGDLFESLVKRWAGVKDAGSLLPGHGGVLDRIDSSLLALPTAALYLQIVVF